MGAPSSLYHSTSQVSPSLGNFEVHLWSKNDVIKLWLRLIFTLRQLHTSISDICKVFEPHWLLSQSHMHMGAPLSFHQAIWPQIWEFRGSLVEWKWCHSIMFEMFEADIHLKPLQISISDMQSVWTFGMIFQGQYTIPPAKLAPVWENFRFICGVKTMSLSYGWSWYSPLRPCHTSILDICKVFEPHWHAVSRPYGGTLIPFHQPS